jgi:hypothetical protein
MAFDTDIYDFQFQIQKSTNSNSFIENSKESLTSMENSYLDNETQKICKLCNVKIKDCGVHSLNHDLIFCDLICAKIYSDNYEKIDIDFQEYRNNYIFKKLSTHADKIYQKYKYKFFQQLPILTISDEHKNKLAEYLNNNRMQDYKLLIKDIKAGF